MDDLISRKAAIAELDHAAWGKDYDKALAKAMLESLPSAQPKKAKWVRTTKHYKDSEQEYSYYEIHCSECGAKRKIGWHDARFCPNCGAKMEVEHE